MYQIFFYVPETHVEQVKEAIFFAGAGCVGNYSHCSWQVKGEGQFLSLAGSNPYLGEIGKVEKVIEYKVETVCEEQYLDAVLKALHVAHPYETPAFGVVNMRKLRNG